MIAKALRDLLQRVETWPQAQEEAVNSLLSIEQELANPHGFTDEDRAAIERGLDDMRHGRFATEQQVSAAFRRRG
jgi:predicted transcriptional regulator